jgi:hypothetical protein
MKKYFFNLVAMLLVLSVSAFAQKWADLSKEEKLMKLQNFIEDNHKYMKDSLALSEEQVTDADNVNACYLTTLDRINRYAKTDADKEKYAKSATESRAKQLEAIMGSDKYRKFKYRKFKRYVEAKLKKAAAQM